MWSSGSTLDCKLRAAFQSQSGQILVAQFFCYLIVKPVSFQHHLRCSGPWTLKDLYFPAVVHDFHNIKRLERMAKCCSAWKLDKEMVTNVAISAQFDFFVVHIAYTGALLSHKGHFIMRANLHATPEAHFRTTQPPHSMLIPMLRSALSYNKILVVQLILLISIHMSYLYECNNANQFCIQITS